MEMVLNLLLIRFALIGAGLVVVALLLVATTRAMRRRGRGDQLLRFVRAATRLAIEHLDQPPDQPSDQPSAARTYRDRRRRWVTEAAVRAVAQRMDKEPSDPCRQVDDQ